MYIYIYIYIHIHLSLYIYIYIHCHTPIPTPFTPLTLPSPSRRPGAPQCSCSKKKRSWNFPTCLGHCLFKELVLDPFLRIPRIPSPLKGRWLVLVPPNPAHLNPFEVFLALAFLILRKWHSQKFSICMLSNMYIYIYIYIYMYIYIYDLFSIEQFQSMMRDAGNAGTPW